MTIHDSDSDFTKTHLSEAFVYGGLGAAFFESQGNGIEPILYNLTRCYTNSILPAMQKGLLFVAEEDGKLVGLSFGDAGLNVMYRLKAPIVNGAYTVVIPSYRRRGIATKLRLALFNKIKEDGYKLVFCQIYDSNEASLASLKPFFDTVEHKKFHGFVAELYSDTQPEV